MKCPRCGLMQKSQPRCRRCGNPVDLPMAEPSATDDPYAPPVASLSGLSARDATGDLFRDGKILVARDGTLFPDRCVRCNEPTTEGSRFRKTFYWHSPSWYALLLLNILIYAIVAYVVRKKASFELALCARHRSRRQWCIAIGFGLPILAFMLMMASEGNLVGVWLFLLALLVGAVVGVAGSQVLTPKKIDEDYAYLKGAHPQFLANLRGLR